ncbi:MAG: hypothetical protein HOQ24_04385 [Mycobacteriaceae bacterium]|nr:hypothetical protein [Mycobacteriaceae bacterium]
MVARQAWVFTVAVVGLALATMLGAAWWPGGHCPDARFLECRTPARDIAVYVPPVILGLGGIGAFVAAYRSWRAGRQWWIWQGAGWALFIMMSLYAAISASALLQR